MARHRAGRRGKHAACATDFPSGNHARPCRADRRRTDDRAAYAVVAAGHASVHRGKREGVMNIPVFPETKVALKGRKGLIVGIANDQSIAWGCAKAFRALGADLAVTYLNDRARKYVEPLAKDLDAAIVMPLDVNIEGQTEQVFERIKKEWG